MQYIVTELLTVKKELTFSLIGAYADKKKAAAAAAEVYKDYNKNASLQNVEMITEWLATRQKYSFRKDKEHRRYDPAVYERVFRFHSVSETAVYEKAEKRQRY